MYVCYSQEASWLVHQCPAWLCYRRQLLRSTDLTLANTPMLVVFGMYAF